MTPGARRGGAGMAAALIGVLVLHGGSAWALGPAPVKRGMTDRALADFKRHSIGPGFAPALRDGGMVEPALGRPNKAKAGLASGSKDDEAAAAYPKLDEGTDTALGGPIRIAQSDAPDNAGLSGTAAEPLTPTQRAEQEATRQLQAIKDAEQARQAAVLRLKAERLAAAGRKGRTTLVAAADFVRANHDDPTLVEHLQRIADLNGALAGTEPAPIEAKTAALAAGLAADPFYVAYAGQHVSAGKRDAERDLVVALQTLRVQKTFLIGAVVQDPTGPAAGVFLGLAKQVDGVVGHPDLAAAQTLVGTVDAAIGKAGLRTSYAAAQAAAATDDASGGAGASGDATSPGNAPTGKTP